MATVPNISRIREHATTISEEASDILKNSKISRYILSIILVSCIVFCIIISLLVVQYGFKEYYTLLYIPPGVGLLFVLYICMCRKKSEASEPIREEPMREEPIQEPVQTLKRVSSSSGSLNTLLEEVPIQVENPMLSPHEDISIKKEKRQKK